MRAPHQIKTDRRRLVLYSGGQERRNALIHTTLLELALRHGSSDRGSPPRRRGVRMTYMPFTHEGALPFYRRFERRYRDALCEYSRNTRNKIYACPDGSGIVCEGDRFTAHGEVWLFDRGHVGKLG